MTEQKTILIPKDPHLKGTPPTNYKLKACRSMMWKMLTVQIRDKTYWMISRGIYPDEQKECRKRTRGTEELLYKDQNIHNEYKTRRKNLAMAWIVYKKVYDIVQ